MLSREKSLSAHAACREDLGGPCARAGSLGCRRPMARQAPARGREGTRAAAGQLFYAGKFRRKFAGGGGLAKAGRNLARRRLRP